MLTELPPKIIQDLECEMSPLQQRCYQVILERGSPSLSELGSSRGDEMVIDPSKLGNNGVWFHFFPLFLSTLCVFSGL